MKIQPTRVEGFIAKPDAKVRAVLLYGPDAGLVRERMNALTRNIAGSTDDLCTGFSGWQVDMKRGRSGILLSPQGIGDGPPSRSP